MSEEANVASINAAFDRMVSHTTYAMLDSAWDTADELKKRLGVPVQISVGPRGGKQIIRSKRGEYPRKEKGKLQGEVYADVIEVGDVVSASVVVPTPYADPLQNKLDRLITNGDFQQSDDSMIDAVSAAVEK